MRGGELISTTGDMVSTLGCSNLFRYRGYAFDEETAMYYLRSRYYMLKWSRFINADVLLSRTGQLLSSNQFAYSGNSPVAFADPSGHIPDNCTHANFKETFYVSGAAFEDYLKWQHERHEKTPPAPPILDAIENTLQKVAVSKVVGCLKKLGEAGEALHDYGSGIHAPFFNYNRRMEDYIVSKMTADCAISGGYKAVKVELLYGSHSAEVRLTLLDQHNNLIKCAPVETQGYEVILDMMTSFDSIVKKVGGFYTHEGVEWKYSFVQ